MVEFIVDIVAFSAAIFIGSVAFHEWTRRR